MRRINDRDSQFIFDDADTTIDEVAAEFVLDIYQEYINCAVSPITREELS